MPCYYPLDGWRSKQPNDNGKFPIVFERSQAQLDSPLRIPCGRCIGCRLEYSRQWALRCLHESSLYEKNCFLTLTYNDDNLPPDGDLLHDDFQRFMKRLRKRFVPTNPFCKKTQKQEYDRFQRKHWIRFYMCGEYGSPTPDDLWNNLGRPHYHAILFNFDFHDKEYFHTSDSGSSIYTSDLLDDLWNLGHASIGDVTFESAAYVARYCTKKITGEGDEKYGIPSADEWYTRVCLETGIESPLTPEYVNMSRNPGIAYDWFRKYQSDLTKDYVTVNGIKHKSPKYYDTLMKKYDDGLWSDLAQARSNLIDPLDLEYSSDRLRTKEQIKKQKLKLLPRTL